MSPNRTCFLCLCLASCAAPMASSPSGPAAALLSSAPAPLQEPFESKFDSKPVLRPEWHPSQPLMHGFLGVSFFEHVEVDESGPVAVDGDRGELDQLPLIGGGAQWKFGGERVDYGLEGLMSFSWRGDAEAFVVGGGGAAVAVDVDLLLFELYGGPFASTFLGDRLRLYGAAGPLLQFADYAQSGSGLAEDGSGFGVGWYARTGLEFLLPSRTLVGFGARWSDTTVDLDGGLGDLEIDGLQAMLTVSRGI